MPQLRDLLDRFEQTGIPHRTLMRRLRMNRGTLYAWKTGKRRPQRSSLVAVSEGLKDYAREIQQLAEAFEELAG